MRDLKRRLKSQPQIDADSPPLVPTIASDGFDAYPEAISLAFGKDVQFGQLVKQYEMKKIKNRKGIVIGEQQKNYKGAIKVAMTSEHRRKRHQHELRGALELDRAHGDASLPPKDERLFQVAPPPPRRGVAARRVLQSLPRPRNAAHDARNGTRGDRSRLGSGGADRDRAPRTGTAAATRRAGPRRRERSDLRL